MPHVSEGGRRQCEYSREGRGRHGGLRAARPVARLQWSGPLVLWPFPWRMLVEPRAPCSWDGGACMHRIRLTGTQSLYLSRVSPQGTPAGGTAASHLCPLCTSLRCACSSTAGCAGWRWDGLLITCECAVGAAVWTYVATAPPLELSLLAFALHNIKARAQWRLCTEWHSRKKAHRACVRRVHCRAVLVCWAYIEPCGIGPLGNGAKESVCRRIAAVQPLVLTVHPATLQLHLYGSIVPLRSG
jgi:hypothetical protein